MERFDGKWEFLKRRVLPFGQRVPLIGWLEAAVSEHGFVVFPQTDRTEIETARRAGKDDESIGRVRNHGGDQLAGYPAKSEMRRPPNNRLRARR